MKPTSIYSVCGLSRRRFIECLGLTAAVGELSLLELSRADEKTSGESFQEEPTMNAEFRAGVGVRNITPTKQLVHNSPDRAMTVRVEEYGSPLCAKALALSFGGKSRILIALDLCFLGDAAAQVVRGAVATATGLTLDNIVVSCSHTHSAPMIEPPDKPSRFLDFVTRQATDAAVEAMRSQRLARIGHGVTYAVGASFNTQGSLPNGHVKFVRDFREGLASGRSIDPRLSVIRIDDDRGRPIAGWVRFSAHPATVIFDAPISAEYPGYMTERLQKMIEGAPPFLFGYGASGDINCIPMFGRECDSRNLGHRLADLAAETFLSIRTQPPRRMLTRSAAIELPLAKPPSIETLDREIQEVEDFMSALDQDPRLVWVLGFNCGDRWSIEQKRRSAKPLAEWARRVKKLLVAGHRFPRTWTRRVTAWVIDDLGIVFETGETFTDISLAVSARSPLAETLLLSLCNGGDGYLVSDAEWPRGGYNALLAPRYAMLAEGVRPLPYALGAAGVYVDQILRLLDNLDG